MNKGCSRIFLLLVSVNAATLALCVSYNSDGRLPTQKRRIFLRPLLNDEYAPPIPVHRPTENKYPRLNDHVTSEEDPDFSRNRRTWIPLVYAEAIPSSVQEAYWKPLTYSGRLLVKASSPIAVTKKPETIDIPLRKSIRVSHNIPRDPQIQTTGYIKELVVKKVPAHRFTPKPKYTILVDNVKQTTSQSAIDVTPLEDSWRPKKTSLSNVKATKASRRLKPVPFTQFSDLKNVGETENYGTDRKHFTNENSKSQEGVIQYQNRQMNPSSNVDGSYKQSIGEIENKDPYFVQTGIKPGKRIKDDDAELPDLNTFNHKALPPDFKNTTNNDNSKGVGRNKIFIGVEYADSELHGVKHNTSYPANTKNGNGGNIVKVINQDKFNDKFSKNKVKNEDSEMPLDVIVFLSNDTERTGKYIKPIEEKKTQITQTVDKLKSSGVKPQDTVENQSSASKSTNSDNQNIKESEIVDIAQSSSRSPFSAIFLKNNPDSNEFPEDTVYFPPVFSNSQNILGKNITATIKSTSITSNKAFVNNERLIEFNTKQAGKKENDISSSNHANSHRKVYNLPKSETTNDFVSHSYYSPTPPSLITVSSDHTDFNQPLHPNRTQIKTNRTDTYILQMKPALFPDKPNTNRPRKPNIKISSAMLAGILIAALIFLGFLTGALVFVFHQLKFRSRKSKKTDRHKKRAVVYAPEYLDEAFAGNTYIHNNIFLPNPQNLEERLSPELDTSFSVDSDETTQATDHPTTSLSYVNTRNKCTHHHDDIISD